MNKAGVYKNHAIAVLNHEPEFPMELLQRSGQLLSGIIDAYRMSADLPDEEEKMALQTASITQGFQKNRAKVLDTLKTIPGYLFQEYNLPRENGLDIGSGATGFMRHQLLEGLVKPQGWSEMDVNPQAVRANKRLHPSATIVPGSYHHLGEMGLGGKLDMVTGLSTLDATAFMDQALEQISQVLKPDGWFLHIQDVRPGNAVCFQALEQRGITAPFPIDMADPQAESIINFHANKERISVVELFRQRIEMAMQGSGLKAVLNHWMVAGRPLAPGQTQSGHPGASKTYYMNMLLEHLGHAQPIQEAYSVVTLAQKQ